MALLTKVKTRMAIHAHRRVRSLLDGEYASVHTGRSMDFNDLREYVSGDDVKDIDWRATARAGKPLIKRYSADRKHTIQLVVGTGRSMAALCDPVTSKKELAILVAGIFGYLAQRHGDYVGLIAGNSQAGQWERPSMKEIELERMLQAIDAGCTPDSPAADISACLEWAVTTVRRRTLMVVICDDVDITARDVENLRRLSVQHEIMMVTLNDLDLTDPRVRGTVVDVDNRRPVPGFVLRDVALWQELEAQETARHQRRRDELDRLGIAYEHIESEADVVPGIFRLLERHKHAR